MRLWDQWTESKMLKSNEDNFQKQMAFLRKGLPLTDHTHITTYYIMLCARIYFSNKGRPHKESLFYDISYDPSKAELEKNELEMEGPIHIVKSTIDPNSQHMDRQAIKMMMSQTFIQWCEAINIKDRKWVIYHSNDTKLILSDAFYGNYSKGLHIIPINPKQALIEDSTYKVLNEQNLLSSEFINKIFTTEAVKYYITAE